MGVVNLKWRKALVVKGTWFEMAEQDAGWTEAMRLEPVAGLQCNGDQKYGRQALYPAMLAACNCGELPHSVQSMDVIAHYKKVFIGDQYVNSFAAGTERVATFRQDPVYKAKDFFYVTAHDFAAWLAAQGETPSEHIAAWFDAMLPVDVAKTVDPLPVNNDETIEARDDRWLAYFETKEKENPTGALQRSASYFNENRSTFGKALKRAKDKRAERYRAGIKAVPKKPRNSVFDVPGQRVREGKKTSI